LIKTNNNLVIKIPRKTLTSQRAGNLSREEFLQQGVLFGRSEFVVTSTTPKNSPNESESFDLVGSYPHTPVLQRTPPSVSTPLITPSPRSPDLSLEDPEEPESFLQSSSIVPSSPDNLSLPPSYYSDPSSSVRPSFQPAQPSSISYPVTQSLSISGKRPSSRSTTSSATQTDIVSFPYESGGRIHSSIILPYSFPKARTPLITPTPSSATTVPKMPPNPPPNNSSSGPPPLSSDGKDEYNKVAAKLPNLYKKPPIWDISSPYNLVPWIETLENIFDTTGVTRDELKIRLALMWVTYATKEILNSFDSVITPNWNQLTKELKDLFPLTIDDGKGSMSKLEEIVSFIYPIDEGAKEKLRLYNRIFNNEVRKLTVPPVAIANRDSVRLYITPFTEEARTAVWKKAREMVTAKAVNDPAINQRRKEDPLMLEEVMEAATKVIGAFTYDNVYSIETSSVRKAMPNNPLLHRRGPINLPFSTTLPRADHGFLKDIARIKEEEEDLDGFMSQFQPGKKPDRETQEKIDLEKERLAVQKDINDALMKEMREMGTRFGDTLGVLTNLVGAFSNNPNASKSAPTSTSVFPKPQEPLNNKWQSTGNARSNNSGFGNVRELRCLMCQSKEHLMLSCPHYQDFLKRGWLVPEGNGSNRVKLKNDQRLPREEPDRPIYKIIEDIAKTLNWDRADSYFANMVEEVDSEMDKQLSPGHGVSVWTAKLEEMTNGFCEMMKYAPKEARESFIKSDGIPQQLKN
jgi:hypothetical protein